MPAHHNKHVVMMKTLPRPLWIDKTIIHPILIDSAMADIECQDDGDPSPEVICCADISDLVLLNTITN